MRMSVIAACVVCCGSVVSVAQAQTEFVRQNPYDQVGGYSSQDARNPGGLGWFSECADDFAGTAGWNINNVKFWGGYASIASGAGTLHGVTIRFYTDSAGLPGTRIFTQDVTTCNETIYYTLPGGNPLVGYSYSCDLSPAFTVPSTGTYWVSVVAIVDRGGASQDPQWGWVQSSAGVQGSSGVQWFFSPGNFAPQSTDFAFVLSNIPVGGTCYANCDASTSNPVLTANDFQCFLNNYAAGASSANCDGSTNNPVLTANDFQCFLNAYAAGCS